MGTDGILGVDRWRDRLRSITKTRRPRCLADGDLPPICAGFAPSYDGAAELFFVNVKHRGIRRHNTTTCFLNVSNAIGVLELLRFYLHPDVYYLTPNPVCWSRHLSGPPK